MRLGKNVIIGHLIYERKCSDFKSFNKQYFDVYINIFNYILYTKYISKKYKNFINYRIVINKFELFVTKFIKQL